MAFKFNEYHLGGTGGGTGGGDNTVVDVESLPTENVDETKIYRTTKATEMQVEDIYLYYPNSGKYITCAECIKIGWGANVVDITYHTVKSLPETMLTSNADNYNRFEFNVYAILETGETYIKMYDADAPWPFVDGYIGYNMDYYYGTVHSVDDMVTPGGCYYLVSGGELHTIYGIPDKENTKTTFEYTADGEWLIRGGIIDTTKLPTKNIKDGVAYRVSPVSEMYVYDPWDWDKQVYTFAEYAVKYNAGTVKLYVVDELPEEMQTSNYGWNYGSSGIIHVYVIESTGIGYVTQTGSSADAIPLSWGGFFGEAGFTDRGKVNSMVGISEEGYYFVKGDDNVSMHTHSEEGWEDYINGDAYNAVVQERDAMIIDQVILATKCNIAPNYITDEGVRNFFNKAECALDEYSKEPVVTGVTDKNITSITIPNGFVTVYNNAFENCTELTSVVLSEGVQYIYSSAFSGCTALTSVVIPEGVTSISEHAFSGCTALTSVVFPKSLFGLGSCAFKDCTSMQYYDFTALTHVPPMNSDTFANIPANCQIRVADSVYAQWASQQSWSKSHLVKASEVV